MAIKESGQMYLETILILSAKSGSVHAIDVADHMNFSKPSVSRALHILRDQGLIDIDAGGNITLKPEGRAIAESIYDRHNTIAKLLMSIGVSASTAEEDACRIEHYISEETFAAIKRAFG